MKRLITAGPARIALLTTGVFVGSCALFWPQALSNIGSRAYLPHGFCYLWNAQLLELHVTSDLTIFASYLAISILLAVFFVRERRRIPFAWIVGGFGVFIVSCGFTHLMEVVVLWTPLYWLAGDVKLVTAIASMSTAFVLPSVLVRMGSLIDAAARSERSDRRFRAASDGSHSAFFILESERDARGEIVDFRFAFVNETGARLISSTPEDLSGALLCERYPVNRTDGYFELYKQVVETGASFDGEFPIDDANVRAGWLRLQVAKLEDGVAVTTTDITAQKRNERDLEVQNYTKSIVTSSPFATIVTDLDGVITSLNPAAETLLGYDRDELVGRATPLQWLLPEEIERRAAALSADLDAPVAPDVHVLTARFRHGLVEEAEWTFVRRDGHRFAAQMTASPLRGPLGEDLGLIVIAYDITERKRTEAYVSHLAHHDPLTGLPTRALLQQRLAAAFERADRDRSGVGVLMVDLDNFKSVNDVWGHHAGDELLRHIATVFQEVVRRADTVARLGGDEFVIVLDALNSVEDAERIARKIIAALNVPVRIGTDILSPSASIGICMYPEGAADVATILRNADIAMYRAKGEGKSAFQTFSATMANASSRRRLLEAGLAHALSRHEFQLVYQPQISFDTGVVTGVEALLRWQSAELGLVMPNEFIPLLEESGQIVAIGKWIVRAACRHGNELRSRLGRPITVAINVSPRQFQTSLPGYVRDVLSEEAFDPSSLEFEITENVVVGTSSTTIGVLHDIRSLGIRVAIDDFGTGYSSMSYIMRFPVDLLKIDQSFVRGLTIDATSAAMTRAVIALAGALDIAVMAEGVETAAQRDLLMDLGCRQGQGYFYSKPVALERLAGTIHELEALRA